MTGTSKTVSAVLVVDLFNMHTSASSISESDHAKLGVHLCNLLEPLVTGPAGFERVQVTIHPERKKERIERINK